MGRKPFQTDPQTPYHLCARANAREWFALNQKHIWEIMSDYLHFSHHAFGTQIHSFVLMRNHFHMIASFPNGNLSEASQYFMRETSRSIAKASGRINHVYGARIFRSRLASLHYYEHAYKYIYRNPVEVGAATTVEGHPYSTLSGLLGLTRLTIPLIEDTLLFTDMEETLRWLNTKPSNENRAAVQSALRRADFKLKKSPSSRKPHELETMRL